jgi:hypothetical protein
MLSVCVRCVRGKTNTIIVHGRSRKRPIGYPERVVTLYNCWAQSKRARLKKCRQGHANALDVAEHLREGRKGETSRRGRAKEGSGKEKWHAKQHAKQHASASLRCSQSNMTISTRWRLPTARHVLLLHLAAWRDAQRRACHAARTRIHDWDGIPRALGHWLMEFHL